MQRKMESKLNNKLIQRRIKAILEWGVNKNASLITRMMMKKKS